MSINFGGKTIYKPGAYSQITIDSQAVVNPGTARVLAILGPFDSTATYAGDGIVRFYNDPAAASDDLKTGDTLQAMKLAWAAHGADSNGQTPPSADVIAVVEVIGTGSAGALVTSDWQTALDKLKAYNIDAIVPISGEAAVHGQVKDHVISMSDVKNRRERRAFVGGNLAETMLIASTSADTLDSGRMSRIYGGVKKYVNGVLTTLPGYLAAALVAGAWAGKDASDPITFDRINVEGLELSMLPNDIDNALQAGLICFEASPSRSGFRIVQGITTAKTDISVETVIDELTVEIRNRLEEGYVGTRGDNKTVAAMQADVAAILENAKTQRRWLVDEIDHQGNVISPAYTPPIISRMGTVFTVSFGGNVVQPTNFVLLTPRFRLA